MTHNFRPTQPIYDRVIYYNSGVKEITENIIPNEKKKKSAGYKSFVNALLLIVTIISTFVIA